MMSGDEIMRKANDYIELFKKSMGFYNNYEYDQAIKHFDSLLNWENFHTIRQQAQALNIRVFTPVPTTLANYLFHLYKETHIHLAKIFIKQKWSDDTFNILNKLSNELPREEHYVIWVFKAKTHISSKQYQDASSCIEQAIKMNPKDPLGYVLQAELLFSSGKFSESLEYIEKTFHRNIEHFELWATKGKAHLELQQYDKAVTAFQKAYSLQSAYLQAHRKIADAYIAMKDYKNALLALAKADSSDIKAAQLKKQIIFTLWREANIALENHQPKKAVEHFKLIVDFANNSKEQQKKKVLALTKIGDIYFKQNIEFALKQYDAALQLDPNCMSAMIGKASVLIKQNNYTDASPLVEKVLEFDPYNDVALDLQNILHTNKHLISNNNNENKKSTPTPSTTSTSTLKQGFLK